MDKKEKKAFILLKAVILYYHGLDDDERLILEETAQNHDAHSELSWALEFIREDYITAFDRARDYLNESMATLDRSSKISYLMDVWKDNYRKGYITEMEATAMLNLASDWQIQREVMTSIRNI